MKHVLITQPYVPQYRVPFFDEVSRLLATRGVTMTVAAGLPQGIQSLRGDSAQAHWLIPMTSHTLSVGGRDIAFRKPKGLASKPDLVVTELEGLNTFAWSRVIRRAPTILWGHGKSYVTEQSRFADQAKWALARRVRRVMTYAPSGRDHLVREGGLHPDRVTSIGNSTDTKSLRHELSTLTDEDLNRVRSKVGDGLRALYVGGLDESKRVPFLIEAARAAVEIDPKFKLIIAGRGDLETLVQEAQNNGEPVVYFGEARGRCLAALGKVSDSIWMPGRVGLVAVDALALGLPLLTTHFRYHAPEIEFLEPHELRFLPDEPRAFAREALAFEAASSKPEPRHDIPSIEAVALAYATVILSELDGM